MSQNILFKMHRICIVYVYIHVTIITLNMNVGKYTKVFLFYQESEF